MCLYLCVYLSLCVCVCLWSFLGWMNALGQNVPKPHAFNSFQVTFTNEQSGEYQFYEVQLRSTKPGVIANIDLSTPVRQSVPHTIRLDNPLTYPMTFNATCNILEVLMPASLSVPAQSQVRLASVSVSGNWGGGLGASVPCL